MRENGPEEFMGSLFGMMAEKVTIRSHEPHRTLKNWPDAWPEVERRGWVKVEPFNNHGSIVITATPEGVKVALAQSAKIAAEMFGVSTLPAEGCDSVAAASSSLPEAERTAAAYPSTGRQNDV